MDTKDIEKEKEEKEILDKLMKDYEQEQMRLHPEIYDKKLNNEIDK